jgi:ABC-type glycerol-3-phosphate transport system permease component
VRRSPSTLREGTLRAVVILVGLGFALPYLVMLTASMRPSQSVTEAPLSIFGGGWSLDNYIQVLDSDHILHYYVNSVITTVAIVGLQVVIGVLAAFALGHLRPPGSRALIAVFVAVLSVPEQALLVPNYLTLDHLGLLQSRWALILPFAASAFGIYFIAEFVASIPGDQLDAARMFSLGPFDRFRRMVLPHIRPAVLAFAAFSFVGYWNEFFWPLVVLQGPKFSTVPFSIQAFLTVDPSGLPDWGPMMAAGSLALIPVVILLVLVQRSFAATLGRARI